MQALDQGPIYVSGEWEVDFSRRELRCGGTLVPVGGRTFEIIEVLVVSAGKLVTKKEIASRVWPGAIVEDNTLQVHISAIRRAFGQDRGMLKTESGRGYRLLGPWQQRQVDQSLSPARPASPYEPTRSNQGNLPTALSALVGRGAAEQRIRDLLSAYRTVTLTGPGGIGKTVLALEVARSLNSSYQGEIWLVELASLSDPALVPSAIAHTLGLKLGGDQISPESVARAIGIRQTLIVLDNCEHVVEASAWLAEALVRYCPRVSILATSRELLGIEGECVYRVPPLEVPPRGEDSLARVLEHSAVQLFVAKWTALGSAISSSPEQLRV